MHFAAYILTVAASVPGADVRLRVCPSAPAAGSEAASTFASVHEAAAEAKRMRATGHRGGIVLSLCEGPHRLTHTLMVGPELTSASGETAIVGEGLGATLDAGLPITGWADVTPAGASLTMWRAPLPADAESRQLWVGDRRAARAHATAFSCSGGPERTGCTSPFHGGAINTTGYTSVPVKSSHPGVPTLGDWLVGSELVYGRDGSGATWTEPRCPVVAVSEGKRPGTIDVTVEELCWARARGKGSQSVTMPTDVENALPLLDRPGEWYADFGARELFYAPREGETIATLRASLGTLPKPPPETARGRRHQGMHRASRAQAQSAGPLRDGESISVLPGASNLRIEGLTFAHSTWLEPSHPGGFVDLQSGYFSTATAPPFNNNGASLRGVPGALGIHGAKDVRVRSCEFVHQGRTGVVIDEGSQGVVVSGSTFSDLSGSAVSLGNVSEPIMAPEEQDGNHTVSSNVIDDTAIEYHGCAAVVAGYVAHTAIVSNTIEWTSNGGICLGWGWGVKNSMRANNVSSNFILRSNTELSDCGSIYTLSHQPDSVVSYNYIEHQALLYGSLYHDARSSGFHTHHNVVGGGPMWLYLQWGKLGATNRILIERNYHNVSTAGGCACDESLGPMCHASTCKSTGYCPQHYPAETCGQLIFRDNVQVSGSQWPPEALAIKTAAGAPPRHGSPRWYRVGSRAAAGLASLRPA